MSFFPFALWIDRHKPCDACMDSLLVNLIGSFHLMANKVIMHDRETSLHYTGDFYYWINKVITCFVVLSHSISTCLCNPVTRNSPWWVNIFFIRVLFGLVSIISISLPMSSHVILPQLKWSSATFMLTCGLLPMIKIVHGYQPIARSTKLKECMMISME